jgi:CDP-diacylglycerol--serine O-phosphatidyltransferase
MSAMKMKNYPNRPENPGSSRLRKSIYLLPNLFTAGNLVLGILSIAFAINDSLTLSLAAETKVTPFLWPARLIVIAAFMDFIDGFVARLTNTTSKFGMEFDSLSDLISFGVAPAMLIYLSVLRYIPFWGLFIMALYVVCAAIRLARFNVQAQIEEKTQFMGLPSPAAAGLLASYVLFSQWGGWYGKGIFLNKVMGWYEENISVIDLRIIPILTVVIALVMVSSIRYPSMKKLKGETVKPITLGLIVMLVFSLFYAFEFTSFVFLSSYLLWGIAQTLIKTLGKIKKPRTAAP